MSIKRRRLRDIQFVDAPNRTIGELFSGVTYDAQGITCRIVDLAPASQQEPRRPHKHLDFEETIHFLAGRGRMWADGRWFDVEAGDTVLVPPGVMHATFNASEEPLRLICFFPVPAGVDARVRGDEFLTLASDKGDE